MTNGLRVVEYVREDGSNPYRTWFDGLHARAAAKVASAVVRLELGNLSRLKWIGAIREYRIDWGPGYRVYLTMNGDKLIILLGGRTKQRQQADIERAKAMCEEYKARKAAAAKPRAKR
jgi:putative addiction module killer protein